MKEVVVVQKETMASAKDQEQIVDEKVKPSMEGIAVLQKEKAEPAENDNVVACCSEECMARYQELKKMNQLMMLGRMPEELWDPLKTKILIGVIIVLVVWVIVFTTLGHLGLL